MLEKLFSKQWSNAIYYMNILLLFISGCGMLHYGKTKRMKNKLKLVYTTTAVNIRTSSATHHPLNTNSILKRNTYAQPVSSHVPKKHRLGMRTMTTCTWCWWVEEWMTTNREPLICRTNWMLSQTGMSSMHEGEKSGARGHDDDATGERHHRTNVGYCLNNCKINWGFLFATISPPISKV